MIEEAGFGSLARGAVAGACPQCQQRSLFDGLVQFAPRCRSCGLDFSGFNVGDGPAAFLTLIVGALIIGIALTVEVTFTPPMWVHALLWIPLTSAAVIGALRVSKAALLIAEYRSRGSA